MALPPTIPTSFVPRTTPVANRQTRVNFTGVFDFIGYLILFVVFVLAIGVFAYGRILAAKKVSDDAALQQAQSGIDQATVEGFVRLEKRLTSSKTLMAGHVELSSLFDTLGKLLPTNVRLTDLQVTIDAAGVTKMTGGGVAKSFNALAAASSVFASDGRIKNVIFSDLTINKDNSVQFSLSATLDPKIITYAP